MDRGGAIAQGDSTVAHTRRQHTVSGMRWGAILGATVTAGLGATIIWRVAEVGPAGVVRYAVLFLIALSWTVCTGIGVIIYNCTEVVTNVAAASLLLGSVNAELDTGQIRALRVVKDAR